MRRLAKRILPISLHPWAWYIYAKTIARGMDYQPTWPRKRPRFITMQYDSHSVLQCCVAYNKYGGYCVPLSSQHSPAAQKILSGDVYEPNTIEFLISNCNDGDIVHAGTYFGDFLPALSWACGPNAKIWAFEPHPENFRCALITSYINELQNVELTNAGLGERQDSLVMVTTDSSGRGFGGSSRIMGKGTENSSGGTETVQIVTIDEVVPSNRKISLIHLDVENYEKPALCGALKTIQRCLPIMVLETLPEDDWLSENILALGYRVGQKIHFNTILVPEGVKVCRY